MRKLNSKMLQIKRQDLNFAVPVRRLKAITIGDLSELQEHIVEVLKYSLNPEIEQVDKMRLLTYVENVQEWIKIQKQTQNNYGTTI